VEFETAIQLWHDGQRRLERSEPELLLARERVVEAIVSELRRRLGGTFTTEELVELYDRGTDWCLDLASRTAPDAPWAWDTRVVGDAAFARYVREAADYAGGRRVEHF
jgi:hypothetical protein